MTDDRSDDPQREVERLTEKLERREREIDELKQKLAPTKEVQDELWAHDIYLKARRKMLGGVIAVRGVLSALGLVTVYDLYQGGLKYAEEKMNKTIEEQIDAKVDEMLLKAERDMAEQVKEMIADAGPKLDERVDQQIGRLVEKKRQEISSLIADAKTEVEGEIAQLKEALKLDRVALAEQARQIRLGMAAPAKAVRFDDAIPLSSVACDPNYLDDAQIARVGVRQLSKATGNTAGNGRPVFENNFFLDVRGSDETTGAAEAKCILDAVDRVVYGADPRWYSPSEFVRIDRDNEFRFTVSGWGPTVLTAQVYFIGRRDPESFEGHLAIRVVSGASKKYLGDAPVEFQ
ncbi:MAG: hypothetical protein IIC53_09455 [Proteobacteria bacterium]|nr:hypothetical protein [Pseudomonadota bacterium]